MSHTLEFPSGMELESKFYYVERVSMSYVLVPVYLISRMSYVFMLPYLESLCTCLFTERQTLPLNNGIFAGKHAYAGTYLHVQT